MQLLLHIEKEPADRKCCPCSCLKSCQLVKLKICLVRSSSFSRTGYGFLFPFSVHRHFLDPIDACLLPVASFVEGLQPRQPCSPQFSLCGLNLLSLRTLIRAPRSDEPQAQAPARIGLANARSLANKTFVLRDFFSSRALDFLCMTEIWIGAGKDSALL